ncbi:hypothetical protein [Halobellus sp. GM3]|uniref:hypothetical protein n=1 Tax=Halobellus sp. GM3 TaxID=3458410 RepID=UPI00403DCC8D
MADTKRGREAQAAREEQRQVQREIAEARERGEELEPPESPRECHRRGCHEPAEFLVLERYLEETQQGPVEATAYLCPEHTEEEYPTNLDRAYDDYVFLIEPFEQP